MMVKIAMLGLVIVAGWAISGAMDANSPAVRGLLLVANQGDQNISVLDPAQARQVATIEENATRGHEIEVSRDGKTAFVPIYGNSGVGRPGTDGREMLVIDIASRTVTGRVDFGHGVRPHCVKLNPRDGMLYVTTEIDNSVTVVDPKTLKIVATVPTGAAESHMLAMSSDGRRGYTANVEPGTVSVLDLVARKTVTTIPIAATTQRISITPDDRWVFTADQTRPQLAAIDTAQNKVARWIELPAVGYGSATTPDGKWLLVAIPSASKVAVVELATMKVSRTVDVPPAPQEVLMRPHVAYVSCSTSGKVAAIDLQTWAVKTIDAGKGADGLAWAE